MKPNAIIEKRIIRKVIAGVQDMLKRNKLDIEIIRFMMANDNDMNYKTARAILDKIKIKKE